MIYLDEPADAYHQRPAFSAGMAWDIVGPDGCPALCFHNCRWLNPAWVEVFDEVLANGVAVHLAILENHLLEGRVTIIDAVNYRTKKAQELRDEALAAGRIPMLYDREPGAKGPSFQKILAMRNSLQNSSAAPLLFGEEGENEVTYTWDSPDGLPCKARADRIAKGCLMIDLKSAPTASPAGFQRSMVSYGHHLRAAFYLDGWASQPDQSLPADYLFVVIQREPPFLVSVFKLAEQAIDWGRKLRDKAIAEFIHARRTGVWANFQRQPVDTVDLPAWAWHQLADREAAGEL